jgi:dTDP-4-dehydrorhamnose reductase
MRVIVTGAGGLLGGRLAVLLHQRGFDVLALHRQTQPPRGLRQLVLELTDTEAVRATLDAERPDALVHAAALGRAEGCEAHPAEADAINARLPGTLGRLCHARGIRFVALSTDLVFPGDRAWAREGDPPGPLSLYGRTKLSGEEAALAACPSAAVVRVALVLGRGHGPRATASEAVAWALGAGRPVRLFTDEYRSPVDAESVATGISRLLALPSAAGRFHLGGPERLSRHELGLRVARVLGLQAERIEAGVQSDHDGPDRRAADVSLDSTRARDELGWEPRPVDEALRGGRSAPAEDPGDALPYFA